MPAERHVFKPRRLRCTTCGQQTTPLLWDYEPPPACACGGENEPEYWHANVAATVIPDDIPGGVLIEHAICNADGTPRRYYSKSEIRAAAKAAGFENRVEHIPERGSDRSRHTTRWI